MCAASRLSCSRSFSLSRFHGRGQKNKAADVRRDHSRRYALQLPFHCLRLRIFAHKLAEFWVVDIQTKKNSLSDKPGEGSTRNLHILHLILLALHFRSLDIQPGSRVRLQAQSSDLPVQILPLVFQRPRLAALLCELLIIVRFLYLLTNFIEATSLLFDVAL